jgi:hypothetical protein
MTEMVLGKQELRYRGSVDDDRLHRPGETSRAHESQAGYECRQVERAYTCQYLDAANLETIDAKGPKQLDLFSEWFVD